MHLKVIFAAGNEHYLVSSKNKAWKKIQVFTLIWNQHNDQLPVGLLAQSVERCTGIGHGFKSRTRFSAWRLFENNLPEKKFPGIYDADIVWIRTNVTEWFTEDVGESSNCDMTGI